MERMVADTSLLEVGRDCTPVEAGVEAVELPEGEAENAVVGDVVAAVAVASVDSRNRNLHTMPTALEVVSVQRVAAAEEPTTVDCMLEWRLPAGSALPKLQLQPSMQNNPVAPAAVEADQVAEEAAGGCMPMEPAERKDFCAWSLLLRGSSLELQVIK